MIDVPEESYVGQAQSSITNQFSILIRTLLIFSTPPQTAPLENRRQHDHHDSPRTYESSARPGSVVVPSSGSTHRTRSSNSAAGHWAPYPSSVVQRSWRPSR